MNLDLGTTFAAALLKDADPGMEGLNEALDGEDALGVVVRCHLYVEAALNDLLRTANSALQIDGSITIFAKS